MKIQPGYIRLHRFIALEYKKKLTDAEYRLLDVYACTVYWDRKKYPELFGKVIGLTIELIRKDHLPDWSVGSICRTTNSLIRKGFLTRLKEPKQCIRVENFWMYQASVPQAERGFQLIEQGIQPSEQNIQLAEQKQQDELQNRKAEIIEKYGSFTKNIQPIEKGDSG